MADPISRKAFLAATGAAAPMALGAFATSPPSASRVSNMTTFSAIGKGEPALDGYGEAELMHHEGEGCLSHMWFGGAWEHYHKTRIRVYVDGEKTPSIDMELGLGHGYGFGDPAAPWGSGKMGKTGEPSGVYNTRRVPFGKSIRITGQRDPAGPKSSPFWWILRGTEGLPVIYGGIELPRAARLKLHRLDKYSAKPLEEFALCDVSGAGALYQVTIAARGLEPSKGISFLEACMRAYIDHSPKPTMLSSGLEDYFTGTYYFNRGRFANELAGLTHLDEATRTFSAYRFHDDDPLFYQKGLRLTCRCGETEHGTDDGRPAGGNPATEYDTYAWVFEW